MLAQTPSKPTHLQQNPCGPACRHAQSMPGVYGEWHWCNHPQVGGRLVRDGHECQSYEAVAFIRPAPSHWWS